MRLMDNSMRVGLDRRLHEFKLTGIRIEKLVVAVREHRLTPQLLATEFPVLVLYMDRASQQNSFAHYLAVREKMILVYMGDPMAHSLYNSLKNGAKMSGHLYIMTESGTLLNYAAGPWGKCSWLDKTWGAGLHLFATLRPTDKLLGRLFEQISEECNLPNNLAGKRQYIREKAEQHSQARSMHKGNMFRLMEWFGWIKLWKEAINMWGSMILIFAFIGIMQNYIKSYKDLFELASARGDADPIPETPIPEEQEDAPPVDPQEPGQQAGSSNDPPAEQ